MAPKAKRELEFRPEFIKKLNKLSKGKFIKVDDFSKTFGV